MTNEEMKRWIDHATYEQLLAKWRFEPIGSPWFNVEVGDYIYQRMSQLRSRMSAEDHTKASKYVGWQQ